MYCGSLLWVRIFNSRNPKNSGSVAQNLNTAGPTRLQNPDRNGGGLRLGFVFSAHRNPKTLASLRKTSARPARTRLQNPDRNGGSSPWVRIFSSPEPKKSGFVAQNLSTTDPTRLQNPDRKGGVFATGFVFSARRNPKTLASLHKTEFPPIWFRTNRLFFAFSQRCPKFKKSAPNRSSGQMGGEQPCISEISNARRSSSRRTHQIQAPNFCRTGRSSGHSDNPPGDE